eukprot:TRINITY_DN3325_c0_g1_i8.p1 TRINITY_DN3325_c0_g1~~TRINITY_DN3325_c0_g1_i8.p1  ORF type:complete len:319 (-),score=77.26 TRINITY_DN3325_c0_g1_i8:207-1163(-)
MLLTQGDLIPVEPEATSIPWTRRKSQILNFLHRGPVDFSTLVYDTNVGDISAISTYFNPDRVSVQDLNSKFGQYPSSNPEKDEKSEPGDVMKPRLLLYPEHNQNQMKAQRTLKWVLSHQEVTSQTASLYDNWQQQQQQGSGWQQLHKNQLSGSGQLPGQEQLHSRKLPNSMQQLQSSKDLKYNRPNPDSLRQLQPSPDDLSRSRKHDSWQLDSSRSLHSSTDSLSSADNKRNQRFSGTYESEMQHSSAENRISTNLQQPQYIYEGGQSRQLGSGQGQAPIGYPVFNSVVPENFTYQQGLNNYRPWENQNVCQSQLLWN